MLFVLAAFVLLGIERFLYGYIYHFPESFKTLCKGPLKFLLDRDEGVYYVVASHLGVVIKVFQFGVIGYDLLFVCGLAVPSAGQLCAGLALAGAGQLLNVAVFNAIGPKGVYYGSQLGYDVPWCSGFPYNVGISDPQYWGVILCVWGLYVTVSNSLCPYGLNFTVPWLETFWYVASMKLLEHKANGSAVLQMLGAKMQAD
mmetsp:Transcript_96901/g.312896  ORF Transcript_96901/g.312896 Transcript_96901/m.312896 type:complete len:200 (-) Transcript_96901:254-853(-)